MRWGIEKTLLAEHKCVWTKTWALKNVSKNVMEKDLHDHFEYTVCARVRVEHERAYAGDVCVYER